MTSIINGLTVKSTISSCVCNSGRISKPTGNVDNVKGSYPDTDNIESHSEKSQITPERRA